MSHHVDVDGAAGPCFGLADELTPFDGEWHAHNRHQLLFASAGTMRVELGQALWRLPSLRAAWIPAGSRHRVSAGRPVSLRTLYLHPDVVPDAPPEAAVFAAPALLREMALHGVRYGPASTDPAAAPFFAAVGALVPSWVHETPWLRLPRAQSPAVREALADVLMRYAEPVTALEVAQRAGMSPRTFARHMKRECGCTFSAWLRAVRLDAAMAALAQPGARVTDVALDVGFESPGAFSRAFVAHTGKRPSGFVLEGAGD